MDVSLYYDYNEIDAFMNRSTYIQNSPEDAVYDGLEEVATKNKWELVIAHSSGYYRC